MRTWNHSPHNVTGGFDFRRQEFNYLSEANPRGTFNFTGAARRAARPAADRMSQIFCWAFRTPAQLPYGNADKYLRQSVYDSTLTDDWRVNPELTINAGLRWEYGAPVTELKNRLVNLDIAPGFTAMRRCWPAIRRAADGAAYPTR